MLVLAIDTCLARCGACLYDSTAAMVLAQEDVAMERGHAEALVPMVQRVLTAGQKTVADIERIAVTTGPGTFTGLRVGLSFARALGLARNIPVVGINTMHTFRLCTDEKSDVALKAGESGLAYVLQGRSDEIELLPIEQLADNVMQKGFPDLRIIAAHAGTLPSPIAMPQPVYIRAPDAKPQILVKQVSGDSAAELAAIHATAFTKTWPASEITALFAIAGTQGFIAEVASEAVGMAITRTIAGQSEILTIATKPTKQKSGVAAKIMNQALTAAKKLGASEIFLEVAQGNLAAQKLYAKSGFTESGRRKAYYANGEDAVLMSLKLK